PRSTLFPYTTLFRSGDSRGRVAYIRFVNPLEIDAVAKSFDGRRALDSVTLSLREGEILGLLGPNGAGKSTLVRTIMGRVRPDAGEVRIFGKSAPAGDSNARAEVGVVPQEIALYPNLSSMENLTVFGR